TQYRAICLISDRADEAGPQPEDAGFPQRLDQIADPLVRPEQARVAQKRRDDLPPPLIVVFYPREILDPARDLGIVGRANILAFTRAVFVGRGFVVPVCAVFDGIFCEAAALVEISIELSIQRPFK